MRAWGGIAVALAFACAAGPAEGFSALSSNSVMSHQVIR
eukprot:CAMPEP_0114164754 /NCGR_PEP_ID=MMETSP0043_2-20121206/30847_1 /TAXON_ID=464988 /ORGANISM="Hemiselmis andersenii, Strain CCMP644" /LENGTH=38 /DNA_ID= /DNA_START= /DNA_END= /DNA_ORIENTATION=